MPERHVAFRHPRMSRRAALYAGAAPLLGLGVNHLSALADSRDRVDSSAGAGSDDRSVIYIFLSGGLAQHDSFDPKPDAPAEIRGEFQPIATQTPGLFICEHLPLLAARSERWALVRSLTHPSNDHSLGHMIMLSGRSQAPVGFNAEAPKPTDWPSIAAVAGGVCLTKNNLPPAVVLPERLIHRTGRVIPGQFAGQMGPQREPWFVEACPFNAKSYGAFPEYEFDHANGGTKTDTLAFQAPYLSLPEGLGSSRLDARIDLLAHLEGQRTLLDRAANINRFDQHRQAAISLLSGGSIKNAMNVTQASEDEQTRYGKNVFGWSLLMARRLVESGVRLVQVNLGNNESWDTHGNAFPNLKDYLLPPTDRALSALLDDLHATGQLEKTLIVMAGEFGRTPRITTLPQHYKLPGRDHWGAVQTVFFAGGGVQGGRVIGSSDKQGGHPATSPQTPENMAATIYQALGLPKVAVWKDAVDRPNHIYHGEPIPGLTSG